MVKTHRISTTISQKYWVMLNKYTDKYSTQQKVLEHALASLENCQEQSPGLSKEEELWIRWNREMKNGIIVLQKDIGIFFMDSTDIEHFRKYIQERKSLEFAFEYYYQKPLKKCSLQEIVDGILLTIRFQGGADTVCFRDEDDRFIIDVAHHMGINASNIIAIMHESMLRTYGAKFKINFSEHHLFIEVYKDHMETRM